MGFYIKHKFIDQTIETKLKEIAELIQNLQDTTNSQNKLNEEKNLMADEQARLRENISVLGDDNQSITLKERYIKKLSDQENRFEEISVNVKKLEKEIDALNKKIQDKMDHLKV